MLSSRIGHGTDVALGIQEDRCASSYLRRRHRQIRIAVAATAFGALAVLGGATAATADTGDEGAFGAGSQGDFGNSS